MEMTAPQQSVPPTERATKRATIVEGFDDRAVYTEGLRLPCSRGRKVVNLGANMPRNSLMAIPSYLLFLVICL